MSRRRRAAAQESAQPQGHGVEPVAVDYGGFTDPVMVLAYSESGAGKSSDLFYAFPNAYFVGPRGSVEKVARTVVGVPAYTNLPVTDHGVCRTLFDIMELIPKLADAGAEALVVDDVTVVGETTSAELGSRFPSEGDGVYARWRAVADIFQEFRDTARRANLHVGLNAHPMSAWVDKKTGDRHKGGPALPGRVAPVRFPPVCDMVLRGRVDPTWIDPQWKAYYEVDPYDPDWYSKDRLNRVPKKCPMNLAEVMRHAGYRLPRMKGLEWMDEVVDLCVGHLLNGASWEALRVEAFALVGDRFTKGWDAEGKMMTNKWLERDVFARWYLRGIRQSEYARYGVTT